VSNLQDLKTRFDDLLQFKNLERPKGIDWAFIKKLFSLLKISPGLAVEEKIMEGLKELVLESETDSEHFAELKEKIKSRPPILFNQSIFSAAEKAKIITLLENGIVLFDKLSAVTDKGRLMQLKMTDNELDDIKECLEFGDIYTKIGSILEKIQPITLYLFQTESIFPDTFPFLSTLNIIKKEFLEHFTNPSTRLDDARNLDFLRRMNELKSEIMGIYQAEHKKTRLDKKQDDKLKKLKNGQKIKTLNKTRQIALMPGDELELFTQKLTAIKPCFSFTPADTQNSPICPHCNYIPIKEKLPRAVDVLVDDYTQELDRMYINWIESIKRHLEDPSAKKSIDLLNTSEKKAVDGFITNNDFSKDADILKEFINAVNKVIKGLERVSFTNEELLNALKEGGYPCTADEIIERFTKFINLKISNKENSRIVL
jgi:hypothetical protein